MRNYPGQGAFEPADALHGQSLAPILKAFSADREGGSLTVESQGYRLTAALREGQPFFALSTDREDRLSSLLFRNNYLSLAALTKAIEHMLKGSQRLGDILVADGILTESALGEALRAQVLEILCRMLAPGNERYALVEGKVEYEDIGFTMPVNAIIRAALTQSRAFHLILEEIGGPNASFAPVDTFAEEVASAGFTPAEHDTVALLEKQIGLRQLCARSGLADFAVCRLVWVLMTIRAVTRLE